MARLITIGVIFLLYFITIGIIFWRRRRKDKEMTEEMAKPSTPRKMMCCPRKSASCAASSRTR